MKKLFIFFVITGFYATKPMSNSLAHSVSETKNLEELFDEAKKLDQENKTIEDKKDSDDSPNGK